MNKNLGNQIPEKQTLYVVDYTIQPQNSFDGEIVLGSRIISASSPESAHSIAQEELGSFFQSLNVEIVLVVQELKHRLQCQL